MKLDLKPVGKIVHNFADCLWITRQVGSSAAGGRRRGKEVDGALSGYFVIGLALGLHCHRDGIWMTFIFLKKPQGI
jgi:hypothetical protein